MKYECEHCEFEGKSHKGMGQHYGRTHGVKYSYIVVEKKCYMCEKVYPVSEFYPDKSKNDGIHSVCKKCHYEKAKKYKKDNPEKAAEYDRRYYRNHREARLKQKRLYVKNNKDSINKWRRKYHKEKYHSDVNYKIRSAVSRAVHTTLKENNQRKDTATWNALPYTPTQLKEHLESQFDDRMSWDTHGRFGWHIDHIIPQSKLIYDSMDHPNFLKCWSLNNLQPLWWDDNLSKGDKLLDKSLEM